MKRRLLVSYLALTAVVLLLLEVPLGVVYARREHDTLNAVARRDASVLAAVAAESFEHPGEHDLQTLASTYRSETGADVAVTDARGAPVVTLDHQNALAGGDSLADFAPQIAAALHGRSTLGTNHDETGPEVAVAVPVIGTAGMLGVVVVAIPSQSSAARIDRAWWGLGGFALILLGVAALLGLWLARGLSQPLRNLGAASRRLGEGDLAARATVEGPAEIATLAAQFNRTADRLSGLVAGQQAFLADASHQLRTPLTALRLRLENLAADLPGPVAGQLDAAEAEVDRLTRLVDGLLALSRAQQQTPPAAPVDISGLVVDRCAAWAALAEEQDVSLTVDLGGETPVWAKVVPGHLEQMLDNLLANAVEVSPPGRGIEVGVRAEEGVSAGADGAVSVHVRDHGRGMSEQERQRAFDRFWQGSTTPTGTTGLGLAIVRQLAATNGGSITLLAPADGGLDAVLRLPGAGVGDPNEA